MQKDAFDNNVKDVFIDNVKESLKSFNNNFKVLAAVIIILFLILLKGGIDYSVNGNMITPFLNLEAPVVVVAIVCLFVYVITGVLLLHSYNSINKNMNALKEKAKPIYDAFNQHPSWIISGSNTLKLTVIITAIIINAAVLINFWPNEKWTTTIFTPLLLSIPLFILIAKIVKHK